MFQDTASIPGGVDFWNTIQREIERADVFLAVVSTAWFRGLSDPDDYVRRELETALRLGVRTIPIFIGEHIAWPMPGSLDPQAASIVEHLRRVECRRVRPDPVYDLDVERLAEELAAIDGTPLRARRAPSRTVSAAVERALRESRELLLSRRFAQAAECLQGALAHGPGQGRANLYLAIARAGGRGLGTLSHRAIEEIAAPLEMAAEAPDEPVVRASALWLLTVLKHDYYFQNGIATSPTFSELSRRLTPAERAHVDRFLVALVPRSDRIARLLQGR